MLCWYADMGFMCGVILGNRQRLCNYIICLIFPDSSNVKKNLACSKVLSQSLKCILFSCFYRTECYDYLLDIAVQMKQCGLNPLATPSDYELKYQENNTSK